MNGPCAREFESIGCRSEFLSDKEGSFSFGSEFAIGMTGMEVGCF